MSAPTLEFAGGKLIRRNGLEGIVESVFTYDTTLKEHQVAYTGPLIPAAVWHQVLSFFRWTYDTAKSESQVRMFIDPVDKTWVAWAFPQEAGTGMTTHELAGKEFDEQRASLPHADKLILFSTVHHHCGGSAFQSSVDEANEKSQDGLHITVGHIDQAQHDLDCRLYLLDQKFTVDMSIFWEIGAGLELMLPPKLHHDVAVFQMCQHREVPFPAEWKTNYLEIKRPATSIGYTGGLGYSTHDNQRSWGWHNSGTGVGGQRSYHDRVKDAAQEIMEDITDPMFPGRVDDLEDFAGDLKWFFDQPTWKAMSNVCWRLEIEMGDVADALISLIGRELMQQQVELADADRREAADSARAEAKLRKKEVKAAKALAKAREQKQIGPGTVPADDYHDQRNWGD